MSDTADTTIPGERAQTSTARKVDNNPLLKRGAVVLAVVAFMGFAMWSMRQTPPAEDAGQPGSNVIRQTTEFEPAKAEPEPVVLPVPELTLPVPVVGTPEVAVTDELLNAARRAPVMAFGGGQSGNSGQSANPAPSGADSDFLPAGGLLGGGSQAENDDQSFSRMLEADAAGRLESRASGQSQFHCRDGHLYPLCA